MNHRSTDPDSDAFELTDVKSEQIRILFAATPSSLLTILISSAALSFVLWPVIDSTIILGWFGFINALSLLRLAMYRKFQKLNRQAVIDDNWNRIAIATGVISGLTWGIGGFVLFAEQSLVHQVFLGFVIAGMCAGAVTTLAAIINSARAFVICALVPPILRFYLINNEISIPMTLMSFLFMAMILISAKRLNQTIVESLSVRHQREIAEQTIRRHAHYDELTELPNRRLLLKTLRQEMAKAERHQRFGALLFIDLDRFKAINDSLGHSIGDELLVRAAEKISSRLRREDTAARLGGDEFVVLLPEVGVNIDAASAHASNIAEEIRKLFIKPFRVQEHDIHTTISIGIALFPVSSSAEELLKYADVAMYQAKKDGRDSIRLFSNEMQEAINERRNIEKGLREALLKNEFELYFQAQYDNNDRVTGAETLIRWNHPSKGVVAPGQFIDVAEKSGLIVAIGDWVLCSACQHLAQLSPELTLSVNVSPRQFIDAEFIDRLQQILLDTGADPARLKIEVTEGLAMVNIDHSIETMKQLKLLGVSFSLDDFGTGYSSLNYLHRLPIDELKIDQSFVRNITTTPDHAVIVDTIIIMAQHLKLDIVAEGVESTAEFEYLSERHCDRFQGYLFSRPQRFGDFLKLTDSISA